MNPLMFKVRTQGVCNGSKGGPATGVKGGVGALWYEDKTFTIATHTDQWLCAAKNGLNMSFPNPFDTPVQDTGFRYLSVCSGMEAASVAWHHLGWKPIGFSEIEPFPCEILKQRFPNVPNYGDLTKHAEWPIEPGSVDLIVGGTPCQAFSVAGLRKGLDDPRGNLALVFLAMADRLRPRWLVWENVPGVLSSSGGRDFGSFIGALAELGYGFAWRVLDSQHFGVAQRRRRVFLVATSTGNCELAASVLSIPQGLCWHPSKGKTAREAAAGGAGEGARGRGPGQGDQGCRPIWNASAQANAERLVDQAGTLTCYKGQHGGWINVPQGGAAFTPSSFAQYAEGIGTIRANGGDLGGGSEGLIVSQGEAFPINTMTLGGRPDPVNDARMTLGVGAGNDPQFTLQASHSHAVAIPPMDVRRLTPIECERLQGFPDNWSRIPWKGKSAEDCPDGPRYKACGNSMAVPVMAFIGRQIEAHRRALAP